MRGVDENTGQLDLDEEQLNRLRWRGERGRLFSVGASEVKRCGQRWLFILAPGSEGVGMASGTINPKSLDKDVNKSIAKLVQRFVKDQARKE